MRGLPLFFLQKDLKNKHEQDKVMIFCLFLQYHCKQTDLRYEETTFIHRLSAPWYGNGVAFQAEGCRSFRPIVTEELPESVIVEMNLQGVHLVIRHHLDQRAQIRHWDELSAAIHHEASQPVGRLILGRTLDLNISLSIIDAAIRTAHYQLLMLLFTPFNGKDTNKT